MKKQFSFACILLINIVTYSQTKYEKGYFISNDNSKIECLIKNEDWSNNPTSFTYKIDDSSDQKTNQISTVKAFGIYNISNFERHTVKLDVSSNNIQTLSTKRSPEWETQTVYLKYLVGGDATLYNYRNKNRNYFFFSKKNKSIEQLIYKKYKLKSNESALNLTYLNQLFKFVNCDKKSLEKIRNYKYNNKSLIKYFSEYNSCIDSEYKDIVVSKTFKSELKFKINSGINLSSYIFENYGFSDYYSSDFGSNQSFRIGFETEIMLPFNNHKWSLFIEPTYSYFRESIEKEFKYGGVTNPRPGVIKSKADINLIEISIGGRHYFHTINEQTKFFLNMGFIWNNVISSTVKFEVTPDSFEQLEYNNFFITTNFFGGIGILLKNKINIEARYLTKKNIMATNTDTYSELNTFSFLIGYTIN